MLPKFNILQIHCKNNVVDSQYNFCIFTNIIFTDEMDFMNLSEKEYGFKHMLDR